MVFISAMAADPLKADRRSIIARAATEILGREGSRGLTHRAIDRELNLPAGTTSVYFRRRLDLILAVINRLVAEDMALLDLHFGTPDVNSTGLDIPAVAELAHRLAQALAAQRGPADLARYECYLAANRDPQLADILRVILQRREDYWTMIFRQLGAAAPAAAAITFDMLLRGIFYRNSLLAKMIGPGTADVGLLQGMIVLAMATTEHPAEPIRRADTAVSKMRVLPIPRS